jgi:DNA mismatch endonuclease (patch repair protein)
VRLRKAVHALGFRFRLQHRVGRFTPDFVLPRYRLAVFVDGCYWHNCPAHGPRHFRGPNANRWRAKIAANMSRDVAANESMKAQGWRVIRVWECETRADVKVAARRVAAAARAYNCAGDDGAD